MMYPSNFWKFMTFSMCSNQLLHQKSTNQPTNQKQTKWRQPGHQIKLTIDMYRQFFNANTGNTIKFSMRVEGDQAVPEKHIIYFYAYF